MYHVPVAYARLYSSVHGASTEYYFHFQEPVQLPATTECLCARLSTYVCVGITKHAPNLEATAVAVGISRFPTRFLRISVCNFDKVWTATLLPRGSKLHPECLAFLHHFVDQQTFP